MGKLTGRMTMHLPCAVIVPVLITHSHSGWQSLSTAVSVHVGHSGRGVCCAKEKDYGACAGFQTKKLSEIFRIGHDQGQDIQGVWGANVGGVREVWHAGALPLQDDRKRLGVQANWQVRLSERGYSSVVQRGEGGNSGEQDCDSDC